VGRFNVLQFAVQQFNICIELALKRKCSTEVLRGNS
jgi:hypothetical protein